MQKSMQDSSKVYRGSFQILKTLLQSLVKPMANQILTREEKKAYLLKATGKDDIFNYPDKSKEKEQDS